MNARNEYWDVASGGASRNPPRFARAGLARVLSSETGDTKKFKSVSGARMVGTRHTAAVISLEAIRYGHMGKDSVITSDPWISVQRGVERGTARSQRKLMTDLKWIKLVAGGRAGFPARVRFTRLPAAVGAVVLGDEMYATVGAIAAQEDDGADLIATIFRSAAHPAWTYTDFTSAHWLVALADGAGVDPEPLGVAARRLPKIRKELVKLFGAPRVEWDANQIAEALDEHAIATGAFVAHEAAEEARRIAAAERKAEVMEIRAEKKVAADLKAANSKAARDAKEADRKAARSATQTESTVVSLAPTETVEEQGHRLTTKLLDKVGALPSPADGVAALKAWAVTAEPLLAACSPALRMALANNLYPLVLAESWEAPTAAQFAQRCAGEGLAVAA